MGGPDDDGNLTADERATYAWNAAQMLAPVAGPFVPCFVVNSSASCCAAGRQNDGNERSERQNRLTTVTDKDELIRIEYIYDNIGRKVAKKVFMKDAQQIWQLLSTTLYLYDGWNLICERQYDPSSILQSSSLYTWGLDISNTPQSAGGVGGLLSCHAIDESEGGSAHTYYPSYDGNGNLTAYITTTGTTAAEYEYSPFGKTLRATIASDMSRRSLGEGGFSTKYYNPDTGLYNYGLRHYNPTTGRWLSRDPIQEQGGLNVHGFVGNDGVNKIDIYGLIGNDDIYEEIGSKSTSVYLNNSGLLKDDDYIGWKDQNGNVHIGDNISINHNILTQVVENHNLTSYSEIENFLTETYTGIRLAERTIATFGVNWNILPDHSYIVVDLAIFPDYNYLNNWDGSVGNAVELRNLTLVEQVSNSEILHPFCQLRL